MTTDQPLKYLSESESVIVVVDDAKLLPEKAKKVRAISPRIELIEEMSEDALQRAHVIYTNMARFNPAKAANLRFVQTSSAAVNHVLEQPIAESGIPIANVRGAYTPAVAECAITMLLALARRLPLCHSWQLEAYWPKVSEYPMAQGEDCYGSTIGIVGYGSIGRHIARVADAIGMKVLAYDLGEPKEPPGFRWPETGDPDGTIPHEWFGDGQLHAMLPRCDYLVITLPITKATRGIIGPVELEKLPSHAYVINIGRGGTLDEEALIECLRAGKIAGAGLDVFQEEPLPPDSPLWKTPNLLIMPHIASYSKRQLHRSPEVLIENLSRFLNRRPLINVINPDRGF